MCVTGGGGLEWAVPLYRVARVRSASRPAYQVAVYDWATATGLCHFQAHVRVSSCTFSPDGAHMLSAGDLGVKLWTLEPRVSLVQVYNAGDFACWARFMAEGRRIVAIHGRYSGAGPDGAAQPAAASQTTFGVVWDTVTGSRLFTLEYSAADFWCCCGFGDRIVAGGDDGTLPEWHLVSDSGVRVQMDPL